MVRVRQVLWRYLTSIGVNIANLAGTAHPAFPRGVGLTTWRNVAAETAAVKRLSAERALSRNCRWSCAIRTQTVSRGRGAAVRAQLPRTHREKTAGLLFGVYLRAQATRLPLSAGRVRADGDAGLGNNTLAAAQTDHARTTARHRVACITASRDALTLGKTLVLATRLILRSGRSTSVFTKPRICRFERVVATIATAKRRNRQQCHGGCNPNRPSHVQLNASVVCSVENTRARVRVQPEQPRVLALNIPANSVRARQPRRLHRRQAAQRPRNRRDYPIFIDHPDVVRHSATAPPGRLSLEKRPGGGNGEALQFLESRQRHHLERREEGPPCLT